MAKSTRAVFVVACAASIMASRAMGGAEFFAGIRPALDTITKAWETWNRDSAKNGDAPKWPSIKMRITEPPLGLKVTPHGQHPLKYLHELPQLQNFVIADAQIAYVRADGLQVDVSGESDWWAFFQHFQEDGGQAARNRPTLTLKFMTRNEKQRSLWDKAQDAAQSVSQKLRSFGKTLMMTEDVNDDKVNKEMKNLEEHGFSEFEGKGLVFEELGYTKEDWPELIDNLVEAGLPAVWGNTLKLAAKARRGSIKSLATNSFKNGVRTMHYMKYQVLPDGEGGVDGLFAIYHLSAKHRDEGTKLLAEQSFKRFVEVDAHKEWKKEVRQFMPEDGLLRENKSEL